jgi:prephenate dehydrogenase
LIRTVAIVGVGLIGGSFALAIRKAGFAGEILGVSSQATLREAISLGVIDRPATLEEASAAADLIYLANPIGRILEALPIVATHARPDALVTDAGSTKSVILDAAARCFPPGAFLGGHPMAGKATRGVAAAEAALFRGRTYVLTPLPAHTDRPICREFVRILEAIGAKVVSMEAHIHDKVVAITSHLPQLLSTVLATTVLDELPDPQYLAISGRGLADMTRLAASSFDVWSDILNTNQQAIIDALDEYLHALHTLRNQIGTDSLSGLFERAATLPSRLRHLR